MKKRGKKGSVKATLAILIIVIALIFIFILAKTFLLWKMKSAKSMAIEENMTLTEIYQNAAEKGSSFCLGINDTAIQQECVNVAVLSEASKKEDPDVCTKLRYEDLIEDCKKNVIIAAVTAKYKEESAAANNSNIVPSNINLCDELANEADRAFCRNPKQVLASCYNALCY